MKEETYVRVNWPEVQNLMNEDWFHEEAILDNRIQAPSSSYLIPTERIEKKEKIRTISYSISEILLDQIQLAIDRLNSLQPEVKAYIVNKDSTSKRNLIIEITDEINEDDIFSLGMIFMESIKH